MIWYYYIQYYTNIVCKVQRRYSGYWIRHVEYGASKQEDEDAKKRVRWRQMIPFGNKRENLQEEDDSCIF